MQYQQFVSICGAFTSLACASPGLTQSFHSLPDLDENIAEYLGTVVGKSGGARDLVDRRLKLSKCPDAVDLERRSANHLIVHCRANGWRITVPLMSNNGNLPARQSDQKIIERGQPVLLAVRKNGFIISQQMIADRAGGLGDIISVRSSRRSVPVMAEIVGPGQVSLPSF